jgi:predicted  nucleic acid-binding Zn-ribbon protein
VRCLECGAVYSKPAAGGTAETNPGCPTCGYVGWIPVSLPAEPRRSAVRRPPRPRVPLR